MVHDGQSIVLGGLLSSQQTRDKRKMPILGDIPFLGEIFTRRSTENHDRELILFITPNIVRDPSEVQAISIPDERSHFDDDTAPFWRVKRKDWYKKLKKEIPAKTVEPKEMGAYIAARQKLMDEAVKELTAPPPAPPPTTAALPSPPKPTALALPSPSSRAPAGGVAISGSGIAASPPPATETLAGRSASPRNDAVPPPPPPVKSKLARVGRV
jgi:hypothetical protein